MTSQFSTEIPSAIKSTTLPEASSIPSLGTSGQVDLLNLTWEELSAWCRSMGWPGFRARQLYQWMYLRFETDFAKMTNLPQALREHLAEIATVGTLRVEQALKSEDGTQKLLFRLKDHARIEAVLIPEEKRTTLCVSSQVGCALGCRFCYTASMGPGRNLTLGEYMAQFVEAARALEAPRRITNVVFMGMGEPLVNYDRLLQTLTLLNDEQGINLGRRRLTVSTAGLCPQIESLAKQFPVRLAISLHATTDQDRDELMPINKRYNLKALFATLREYQRLTPTHRLPITLEYTLIDDCNHRDEDARRLARLALSIQAKVNLIPYNEHPGAPYKQPSRQVIERFRQLLEQANVPTTCRMTRGDDIYAACGQLAIHAPDTTQESG